MHKTFCKLRGIVISEFYNYHEPSVYISNVEHEGTDPYAGAEFGSGHGFGDSYKLDNGDGCGGGITYGGYLSGDGVQSNFCLSLEENNACFIC